MVEGPREPIVREREEPAPEPFVREREEPVEEARYYPAEEGGYRPPAEPPRTSSLALASLATGIAAWFIFPVFGAIAAVVTGFLAQDEIRNSNGRIVGSPYATAGLVLGWVQIGLIIVGALIVVFAAGAFL